MKRYVIGDIHGGYKALLQCFERCNFNYEEDELVCVGDIADGWPDVYECIEELMKVKKLIYVLGNHDLWALDWFLYGDAPSLWTGQGGYNTIASYNRRGTAIPQSHIDFFKNAQHAYVDDEDNVLFVHGGIDLNVKELIDQNPETLLWDRELIRKAYLAHQYDPSIKFSTYKEIYIGHTTTFHYRTDKPIIACNVIDVDTGGGWEGYLTIMDRDTKEYWQSDKLDVLYKGHKGRR